MAKIKQIEKSEEKHILTHLNFLPGAFAYKVNNVGTFSKELGVYLKQKHKFAPKGPSDILLFINGRCYAIEVKTKKEYDYIMGNYDFLRYSRHTDKTKQRYSDQIRFIENIRGTGNGGFFTHSWGDCREKLQGEGVEVTFSQERERHSGAADISSTRGEI